MAKEILLVEDEKNLSDIIRLNLELEGFVVTHLSDGEKALEYVTKLSSFALVVLDVMLPHVNGLEVCQAYRKVSKVPILFLSAKGTTADRIAGLKLGANDYLPKPFDLEELLLRVSVLINSASNTQPLDFISIGSKRVDFKTYEVSENNAIINKLSKREVDLLKLFASKKGEVVSRDLILDEVWGVEQYPTSRTIDNYILNFRKIFETEGKNKHYFHSIRGVGYKFTP